MYVKAVDYTGMTLSTTSVRSYTETYIHRLTTIYTQVKLAVIHEVARYLRTYISPYVFAPLPLIEHYLYPVSTGPINYYNQKKI